MWLLFEVLQLTYFKLTTVNFFDVQLTIRRISKSSMGGGGGNGNGGGGGMVVLLLWAGLGPPGFTVMVLISCIVGKNLAVKSLMRNKSSYLLKPEVLGREWSLIGCHPD